MAHSSEGRKKGLLHSHDRIYVTQAGLLRGFITMASLLTNTPDTPVSDVLIVSEEVRCHEDTCIIMR